MGLSGPMPGSIFQPWTVPSHYYHPGDIRAMNVVMTVAGSDSIGGAGVQADLKAIAAMDLHGACAITAITAQNTTHVAKIRPVPPADVVAQIKAVLEDAKVDAIKTGMLYSADIVATVQRTIKGLDIPLVLDPVLIAGVGDKLYSDGFVKALKERLIPHATIVTPNRYEAEVLSSITIECLEDAQSACRTIAEMGAKAVLLKGGHFDGNEVVDLLYLNDRMIELSAPRSPNKVHGAGCTVASFLACNLAKGMDIKDAALDAKRRIADSISMAYPVGQGVMVINPMATKQKDAMRFDVLLDLKRAVQELDGRLPADLTPESGHGLCFALPSPQGFVDVCCATKGPSGCAPDLSYGVTNEAARVLLIENRADPQKRAAICLRLPDLRMPRSLEFLMRDGSLIYLAARAPAKPKKTGKQTGFVSEKLSEFRGMGPEPMACLTGKDPQDVLRKLEPVLR